MRASLSLLLLLLVPFGCGGKSELTADSASDSDSDSGAGGSVGAQTGSGGSEDHDWSSGGSRAGGSSAGGRSVGGTHSGDGGLGGDAGGTGDGGSSDGGSGLGGSGVGGDLGLPEAQLFCEESCGSLTPYPGGCAELYICPEDGECLRRADLWSEPAREAFEWCYENDALCFISAEGCMLDRLFEDALLPHRIVGSGFSVPDGTMVGITLKEESPTSETEIGTVSAGGFSLELLGSRSADFGRPILVWVDVNGDGVCSEGDRVAQPRPLFNGDFDSPAFIVEVTEEDVPDVNHLNCLDDF